MPFGFIIALIITASLLVVVGLLTGKVLKEKVVERLKKWGVMHEAVISKKKLKGWIEDAVRNGESTHLSVDQLAALDEMDDEELVMADVKKNGKIGKVTRIKGEKGIQSGLKRTLEENDGMLIMEA